MTNAHIDFWDDAWQWYLSGPFRTELAGAMAQPFDHKLIKGDGVFANHAYGCSYPRHGGVCDCTARFGWARGIDYSRYTAAEGINEGDDE